MIKLFRNIIGNRNALAWLMMFSAIALHVFDESVTGFLPAYNQIVADLRERLGFFPAPTFSFRTWLGGLIGAVIVGFAATFFIIRGGRIIRIIAIILGILMIVNASGHFFGSIYFGMFFPGMWSSPFLLAAAIFLTIQGITGDWQIRSSE